MKVNKRWNHIAKDNKFWKAIVTAKKWKVDNPSTICDWRQFFKSNYIWENWNNVEYRSRTLKLDTFKPEGIQIECKSLLIGWSSSQFIVWDLKRWKKVSSKTLPYFDEGICLSGRREQFTFSELQRTFKA